LTSYKHYSSEEHEAGHCSPWGPTLLAGLWDLWLLARTEGFSAEGHNWPVSGSHAGGRRDGTVLRHVELKLSCPYFCSWKTHCESHGYYAVSPLMASNPVWTIISSQECGSPDTPP
jgi:hypothetical protein